MAVSIMGQSKVGEAGTRRCAVSRPSRSSTLSGRLESRGLDTGRQATITEKKRHGLARLERTAQRGAEGAPAGRAAMSFLGPRTTSLDAPPRAPQGLSGSVAGPRVVAAAGPPPKPPSLRPAIHSMVGDTPWFEAGGKGTHFGGEVKAPAKSGEDEHWSEEEEEEEEKKKEEEVVSRTSAAAPELRELRAMAPTPAPGAERPAAAPATAAPELVAQADKSTQTEASGDSARLVELEAMVGRLEAEKQAWLRRIQKAKAKRVAKQGEPYHKLRPFVSTLGNYNHIDFVSELAYGLASTCESG
jgi:hypothetical protein